jgi:hypothetical protein
LKPFGRKQLAVIRSFLVTQHKEYTTLFLWANDPVELRKQSSELANLEAKFKERLSIRFADVKELSRSTPLESIPSFLGTKDGMGWFDSDLLRLLVMFRFGGVWIDMDVLLIRDFSPLLHEEFVHQWYISFAVFIPP